MNRTEMKRIEIGPITVQQFDKVVSTSGIRKVVMGRSKDARPAIQRMGAVLMGGSQTLLHETATYVVPTKELIDYLAGLIVGVKAIEICAGNGYIGSNLGIVMTDSYQQQDDKMTCLYYDLMKQPRIKYPPSVIKLEASRAVRRMNPHTVIGCYATHKWREDTQSGNVKGVDFGDVFSKVQRLILVGNLQTHKDNPLMELTHEEVVLPGLLTRAADQSLNRIFIWNK